MQCFKVASEFLESLKMPVGLVTGTLLSCFQRLHLTNMLTDMNQLT